MVGRRHLRPDEVVPALRAGRAVEQWLGRVEVDGDPVIRFLRINRERDGATWSVAYFESFDGGTPEFIDVYEFAAVEPDAMHGIVDPFPSPQEALSFAHLRYAAMPDRWVNDGVVQDEYRDARFGAGA